MYGYVFKQMIEFIKHARTYEYTKAKRKDDLETWLINREKRRYNMNLGEAAIEKMEKFFNYKNEISSVILKTKKAFDFVWQWDV